MSHSARRLDGLQAGRAVAALMVVLFHANVFFLPEQYYGGGTGPQIFSMGYAGVEFFFVLSGFIMIFVHRRDFDRPGQASRFMTKRVLRIYPIYWVIYGLLTLAYFAVPRSGPPDARDPETILTSFLLWPMPEPPVLEVAWSLQYEMLFYLVFTLLVLNLRIGIAAFAIWMAGCLWAAAAEVGSYPVGFLLSPYNLLFAFGILAALGFDRIRGAAIRPVLWAGVGLFLAVGASEQLAGVQWQMAPRTWLYGIGAALAVAALAAGAVTPPDWLVFLGDASYSIYLVHVPAMSFLGLVVVELGAPWDLPPLAMLLILTLHAVIAGAAVHVLIERPLLARLTRRGTFTVSGA